MQETLSDRAAGWLRVIAGLAVSCAALVVLIYAALAFAQGTTGFRYFYDDNGELTTVVDTSGNVLTYTYDPVGNLLSITRSTLPSSNTLAIFGVNPQRGDVGQTVLIQGQGFSATPASNTVQFNGTAATVSAATATQLTVTVPFGATTGPLTVTVGGVTAQGGTFTVNPYVTSITVTPANPSVPLGQTQRFTATGNVSDGTTQDLTGSVTWSSSNTGVATIGSNGIATTVATGTTTVTASLSVPLAPGGQLTGSTTLTVTTAAVVSLAVAPPNFTVPQGLTVQFTATGTSSDGTTQNLTASATWSSSNTAVATISNAAGSQGLATAIATGTTTITATSGTLSASTMLTVLTASGQIPRFAYVHSLDGTIPIFSINPTTGDLRPNGYATYASPGPGGAISQPPSVIVDPLNRFLYAAGSLNQDVLTPFAIWGYLINSVDGTLSPISGSPFSVPINFEGGFSIDPLSRFLYFAPNGLAAIAPTTGALSSFTTSGFCGSSLSLSTAMHPSGKFLYVPTNSSLGICGYSIDPTTGLLTLIPGSPFPPANSLEAPQFVAIDPAGKFAYTNNFDGIDAYTIDSTSGALTLVSGSPYPGGSFLGCLMSEVVDPLSRFLYVADRCANEIWAYTINTTTGALTPIPGSPFSSALPSPAGFSPNAGSGPNGLATDPAGKFLYVANFDSTMSILGIDQTTGALALLKFVETRGDSTWMVIAKGTTAVTYTPKFAYAANSGSNNISAYTIDPASGALTAISGSPFPAGTQPSAVAVHPSGKFAYAVNTSDQTISTYSVDPSTGALTQIGSPIAEGQIGAVGVLVDPSGRFLYVVNTNAPGSQGSVSAYAIDSTTGALTAITGSPFAAGTNPLTMAMDPSGQLLFIGNSDLNNVLIFYIPPVSLASPATTAGALSLVTFTPLRAGTMPASIAVHPSRAFFYVANSGSGNISAFSITAGGGFAGSGFSPVGTTSVGPNLQSVVIDPSGKYLYVVGGTSGMPGSVWGFSINSATGALTPVAGSPFAAGVNPASVTVDISGQFVYVANSGSNNVSVFKIDPATGALTAVSGSPFPAGTTPKSATVTGTIQ